MKKFLLTIILFSLFSASYGQVTINKKIMVVPGNLPCINIEVQDSESGSPLEGAIVKLFFSTGDTIKLVSDRYGKVNYIKKFPKDSICITINYLGYKEIRYTHVVSQPNIYLVAKLDTDPININSIIIKGDRIAMVIRGDTTIYNVSAFKTLNGDPLFELLKKLPGIEIRSGNIYANGLIVKRVLVNGTPMFSDNTKSAIELLKADNIEKIKVYEEFSARDVAIGDTLKSKDRVLDVSTKKKTNAIKQVSIQTLYGNYLDSKSHGKFNDVYSAQSQYDSHAVGNNLIAMFGYGEKSSFSGIPAGLYGNDMSGLLLWDKSSKDYKFNFLTSTMFSRKQNMDYSTVTKDFTPNASYSSRQEINDMSSNNQLSNFSNTNGISFRINKKHKFFIDFGILRTERVFNNSVYGNILLNGASTYLSNMESCDSKSDISYNFAIKHSFNLGKPKRDITSKVSFRIGNGSGYGWSIDTLASGTQKIFISNDQDNHNYNISGEISYTEPLTKKAFLLFKYSADENNGKSRKISIDRITGVADQNNNYDFSQKNNMQNVSTRYIYRSNEIELNVGVGMQLFRQNLNDKPPNELAKSRNYTNFIPNLRFKYSKLSQYFELNYNENIIVPYVEQLRNELNTYNAPLYYTGNESLKETVQRTISIMYSITNFRTFSSWVFNVKTDLFQNANVIKEDFFSERTILPKFENFEFPAGSILQTTKKAKGKFSFQVDAKYSSKSKLLHSNVNALIKYSYNKIPYYLYESLRENDMQSIWFNIGLISDFSKKIELSLSSETELGYYDRNNNALLKELVEHLRSSIRWNFCNRFGINASGTFRVRNTNMPGTALNETKVDTELFYKFGKNYTGNISLNFDDIFNQCKSFNVLLENDFIQTQRMTVLGRNIFLKLSYSF